MNIILQIGKTIAKGLLAGLNELKVSAAPALIKYLELLEKIAIRGIAGPLVLATLAFLGYGVTTTLVDVLQYWGWVGPFWSSIASLLLLTEWLWMTALALAGIVSFAYVWLCGVLAAPIGIAAHASSPAPRSTPSSPVTVTWGGLAGSILTEIRDARIGITNALQAGVAEYVSQVKFALTFIGLTYFFAAIFPGLRAVILLFILGALILTAMREFKHPVASFLRFAVCVALVWCIAGRMFPALNPFVSTFGTSPGKLTMKEVGATAHGTWHFINVFVPASWTKPAFWLLLLVVAPFVYTGYSTLLGLAKKASSQVTGVTAGTDPHGGATPAHDAHHGASSSGGGGGKLTTAGIIAFIALIAVVIGIKILDLHERRGARIGAEMELRKIREIAESERRAILNASHDTVATVTRRSTQTSDPLTIPEGLKDLRNPRMYELTLTTTNWSEEIPRPVGQSIRTHPPDLLTEMRVNGKEQGVRTRVPGVHAPIKGTHSFALRLKEGASTTVVVGVGWETSH